MQKREDYRIETHLIHAGQDPDPTTGAVITPIHTTTTYAQAGIGEHKGFDYSRAGNPTRKALEDNIAVLEGAHRGFAFASGMAGLTTFAHMLKAGDHIVAEENAYGGTVRYLNMVLANFGVKTTYVDASNPKNVEAAMTSATRLVIAETPTNPNLKLNDIKALSEIAHKHSALMAVDNTFASPYLQNPHKLGADIVFHSATKYIGGHSDVLAGLVTVNTPELGDRLHFLQKSMGGVLSPFDSWLLLRGLKTLHVRMQRHCENAQKIAEHLARHPKVTKVNYPGLPSHPQYELAKRQMRGMSGMLSFEMKGGLPAAKKFATASVGGVWTLAESLGAVESLICHPVTMTHASVPKEQRERSGVTDGLVRLSVGLESVDDLIEGLDGLLAKV
ncbi:MAG TPA: PLP-dependent aspartate aminotransferase family protein [Candidatus Thermoplasmatota archaeon]|nr:PLP-dependent aspartate aminotransferase family protein [Candidatus Thermoplasmatota archaeon]